MNRSALLWLRTSLPSPIFKLLVVVALRSQHDEYTSGLIERCCRQFTHVQLLVLLWNLSGAITRKELSGDPKFLFLLAVEELLGGRATEKAGERSKNWAAGRPTVCTYSLILGAPTGEGGG